MSTRSEKRSEVSRKATPAGLGTDDALSYAMQSTAYREATIQRSFLSGTVSTGGLSGALMDVLVSALAVWTASHARRAADDTLSAEETGICVKRVGISDGASLACALIDRPP